MDYKLQQLLLLEGFLWMSSCKENVTIIRENVCFLPRQTLSVSPNPVVMLKCLPQNKEQKKKIIYLFT